MYYLISSVVEVVKSLARAATVKGRVEWLSCDLRIMLVGPENKCDVLAAYLLKQHVVSVRPHLFFNLMTTFAKLDQVKKIRPEYQWSSVPTLTEIQEAVGADGALALTLVPNAQHSQLNITGTDSPRWYCDGKAGGACSYLGDGIAAAPLAGTLNRTLQVRAA